MIEKTLFLWTITALYMFQGGSFYWHGDMDWGLIFVCYGVANLGMLAVLARAV